MIGVGTYKTTEKIRRYVKDVLDSERLSYGPFTQKFERVFAAAHNCRFGVMTSSGTCALMIALAALKNKYNWQDGDEVIVPAVTFVATSNIVLQLNMKPVFVDVESNHYEIDPKKIEEIITERTRCIIPVHLFGQPCQMDAIQAIACKHKLRIIEDSCETMFASFKGQRVGSFGDIGCFSTYVAHILVTGVGGICTTNDADLAITLRSLMNHGRDSIYLSIDDDKNKSDDEKKIIIARRFSFDQMGYSFRVTEFEGALGLANFEDHPANINTRRANARFFSEQLHSVSDQIQLPTIRDGAEHSFMMYPMVLRNQTKTNLVNYLERNGVETREMLPLINQPYYKSLFNLNEDEFPNAKWINQSGFYIGCHQDLTTAEKEHIVRVIKDYFVKKETFPEKTTLVVMSRLSEASFDDVRVQLFLDTLPLSEFDETILVESERNSKLRMAFEQRDFKIVSSFGPKGRSVADAMAATQNENIIFIGIDGSDNASDMNSLLIKLKNGADMVIASRFMAGGSRVNKGVLTGRSLGNRFFTFLVGILFRQSITDTNNLFRGIKQSKIRTLKLDNSNDDVMFEMTVKALSHGLQIEEVPTNEKEVVFSINKRSRFIAAFSFLLILTKNINSGFRRAKKL